MKTKLLVVAALALSGMAHHAATAAAAGNAPTLTLSADRTIVSLGDRVTFSGAFRDSNGSGTPDVPVTLYNWRGRSGSSSCGSDGASAPVGVATTDDSGTFSYSSEAGSGTILPKAGWWAFYGAATYGGARIVSNCTFVTVAPRRIVMGSDQRSTFLCYSKFEIDPAVYPFQSAGDLLASSSDHYFMPAALVGNVSNGTNIGRFHLVCNGDESLVPTGLYIDSGGDLHPAEWAGAMETVWGAPLNVFSVDE